MPGLDAKVSVLKTASIILSSRSSQRYCLAQTLIKTPNTQYIQRYNCAKTQEQTAKSKNKFIHWVASQQALLVYAPS
jgi:hypothetical protein